MRAYCYILLCVLLASCMRQELGVESYRIVVSSPLEALPFLAQGDETKNWNYNWQVIVDNQGDWPERVSRHDADFYVVDFFHFYSLYDDAEAFLAHQALFSTYTDSVLVVRKTLAQQPLASWRFGMSNGALSDYLLDYVARGVSLSRLQVKDDAQGARLLQEGVIDAMILQRYYAQELVATGEFVAKWQSADEQMRLSLVVPGQGHLFDDDVYWRIVQDYRYGLELLNQEATLLESILAETAINVLQVDADVPFLVPEEFNKLRSWRVIQIPFAASWGYENLLWVPAVDG